MLLLRAFSSSGAKFLASQMPKSQPSLVPSLNSSAVGLRVITTSSTKVTQQATSRAVGWWWAGCSGMVFGAVVLGGVTRLTESGLSMVTWKLFGERPPLSRADWEVEFHKYQQFPEFKIKNKDISLEEFRRIWWMEYMHRTWGRLIGAAYYIPAAYFWYRGYFNRTGKWRVCIGGILLAFQGLLGWYMVKSGLEDRFHGPSDVPRVSQYRLAAHLTSAFLLYSLTLWSALDSLLPAQVVTATKNTRLLRKLAMGCKGMIFVTALSGAFVAGLDAGLVYNSFPKMGDKWIPEDITSFTPMLLNVTENPSTVQFDHRLLGTSTLFLISGLWLMSRKAQLPRRVSMATNAMMAMAWLQVSLGVVTLLTYVPTSLAASHQSGSLVLLSLALWLSHELKLLSRVPK